MFLFWLAAICVAFVATQITLFEYRLEQTDRKEETQTVTTDTVILAPHELWEEWEEYHNAKRTKTVRLPRDW